MEVDERDEIEMEVLFEDLYITCDPLSNSWQMNTNLKEKVCRFSSITNNRLESCFPLAHRLPSGWQHLRACRGHPNLHEPVPNNRVESLTSNPLHQTVTLGP